MSAPDDQPEPVDPEQPDVEPTVDAEQPDVEPTVDAEVEPTAEEMVPPTGEELLQQVTADDLDAPDVDPGAADPAAADSPIARSNLLLVGLVLLVLLGLVGGLYFLIQGSAEPAFTVYGEDTSHQELRDRLEGLVSAEALETLGSADATTEQQTEVAQAISTLITLDLLGRAADDEGVVVTEEDVDTQLAEVLETAFDGDQAAFDAQLAQAGLTMDTVRAQFRTALLAEGLVEGDAEPLDPADVQAAYDAQFSLPTVAHILVETEEEAQAAADRIADGEDFGAVAQELSIDPGSGAQGGELGPLQPGAFVPEFEQAALELDTGEVSDPIETDFGFHVITVDDPLPFEEVEEQLIQALTDQQQGERFTALAERLDTEAQVTVDPVFGTWAGLTQGGVVAPGLDEETQPGLPEPPPADQ